MASRRLTDLQPAARQRALRLLQGVEDAPFDVLIYCTFRPLEEQARLFRQGRSLLQIQQRAEELDRIWHRPDLAALLIAVGPQPEPRIVTWAGPGQSLHNYGLAFDGVPLRDGKPVWGARATDDLSLWRAYGDLGRAAGLEWAGDWSGGKREFPHMQEPRVDWRELILERAA